MTIPRVAIIGRPNVGKSSLLNMIAGEKVSIVDPTPGTTRDRVSIIVELVPPDGQGPTKPVEVTDTGGYGAYTAEGQRYNEVGADLSTLTDDIESQIAEAVRSADVILFAVDAQAGITPQDQVVARMLREGKFQSGDQRAERKRRVGAKKQTTKAASARAQGSATTQTRVLPRPPLRIIATKVDGPKWEAHAHEISALGLGEPLLVSAKSNYFRREFLDALYEMLPEPAPEDAAAVNVDLKLAIVGKRNAGKSSLVNTLAGQKRVIVSEIAGTTRDAVDVRFEMGGRSLLAIDTAGLRRKKSFANRIEHFAFDRIKRAIDRADVVFLLVDATEALSQVDEQLAMLVQKAFRPVVIVVNKWDLAEGQADERGRAATPQRYEDYLRKELKGLTFAPISFVSAETGVNLRPTIELAFEVLAQSNQRVTTGKLNRLMQRVLETSNPPSKLGTRAKLLYVAQVAVHPPTIVMVVNRPELFTPNYQRFLLNRFREELPFGEVPIRLWIRGRKPTRTGGIDMVEEPLSEQEAAEVEREAIAAGPEGAGAYFEEE